MISMKSEAEEPPFSVELLELYQEFQQAPSKEARREIAKKMAALFASERDDTDTDGSEEYHEFFESYEQASLKYDQESQKLSRLAVHMISHYLAQNETTIEELTVVQASN